LIKKTAYVNQLYNTPHQIDIIFLKKKIFQKHLSSFVTKFNLLRFFLILFLMTFEKPFNHNSFNEILHIVLLLFFHTKNSSIVICLSFYFIY